jgi:protease-4
MIKVFFALLAVIAFAGAQTIPVYDLSGQLSESGQASGGLLDLNFSTERPLTHFDLVRSLSRAAKDEKVPAVVLEVDQAGFSQAQLQEVSRRLKAIRDAGKDVWIYTENLNAKTAQLGAHANHLVLMPGGSVSLTGLFAESFYFKGLLDKVGVTAHVVHIGDFKSFGESYYRHGPSDPARKQNEELYDALFAQMKTTIAGGRGIAPGELDKLINQGFITPKEALKSKLVNDLQYRTGFIATLRKKYGTEANFDNSYQLPDLSGPEIDGFMDLFSLMLSGDKKDRKRAPYLAVVVLEGSITDQSVAPVRTEILNARKDKNCRGLVLRIDSPGGSALASEVLWEATSKFSETGKPFVVSMGGVAASGGYYVAAGADKIFAESGTITGSIGVVGMKLAFGDLLADLGVSTHTYKRGKHADLYNTNGPFSDEEEKIIRDSMLDVYGLFKKRVTEGRGKQLTDDLEKLAGGRVYAGDQALKHGLVDEIGGLTEAVTYAAKLAGLEKFDTHLVPEPSNPLDGLFGSPEPREKGDEFITVKPPAKPVLQLRNQLQALPGLQLLPPHQQKALAQALEDLASIHRHQIRLVAPPLPVLR